MSTLDGRDELLGIERLVFSDKRVALDPGPGQAAANTARVLGAALGAAAVAREDYAGIVLGLFDNGTSLLNVSDQIATFLNKSNTDLVTSVYLNITGTDIAAPDLAQLAGMLQGSGGTMSQADLLVLAANSDINAASIDLIGLQQSGVN